MSDSIRDQLLALGLAKHKPPEQKPQAPKQGGRPHDPNRDARRHGQKPQPHRPPQKPDRPPRPPGSREPDLAHAYALRAKEEREAQAAAQREAEQKAREKKERKAKLSALLAGKSLNDQTAEHARHFEHHGKIRRVYVTPEQLARLNKGELGVVQLAGRYFLVERECALAAAEIDADALVLLPEPGVDEDGVPADLVW